MGFNLVCNRQDSGIGQNPIGLSLVEVRNADALDQTFIHELLHGLPGFNQIRIRKQNISCGILWEQSVSLLVGMWPMHQVQVKVWSIEVFQRFQSLSTHQIRTMECVPQFAYDVKILSAIKLTLNLIGIPSTK